MNLSEEVGDRKTALDRCKSVSPAYIAWKDGYVMRLLRRDASFISGGITCVTEHPHLARRMRLWR